MDLMDVVEKEMESSNYVHQEACELVADLRSNEGLEEAILYHGRSKSCITLYNSIGSFLFFIIFLVSLCDNTAAGLFGHHHYH